MAKDAGKVRLQMSERHAIIKFMERQPYAAARIVTPKVQAHFARNHAELAQGSEVLAALPDMDTIESLIDSTFWASLRREEGFVPRISLAFLAPEETVHPLRFERPLSLDPGLLARVAPAVERPGIHLGVWREDDQKLAVWGIARDLPRLCFVIEVAAPGLLVIKHHSGVKSGKFINVVVLEGDQIKVIDEHASSLPDCPSLLRSLLGLESAGSWTQSVNVLVQLAVSMRAHGHGGALLVVPSGSESWRESILPRMRYAISPPFSELAELARGTSAGLDSQILQEELSRAVDAVAGLTAVDGAVVMTDQYEVLGFGVKIVPRKGRSRVDRVTITEPIEGSTAALVDPEELGGTRHLSAAQFVQDQRDSLALVASQDGHFTVFEWSHCEATIHAHRIEVLLL